MQPTEPQRGWTPERLREQLARRRAERTRPETDASDSVTLSESREAYRRAAAVLAWFDPRTLRPFGMAEPPSADLVRMVKLLLPDCDVGVGRNHSARWILRPAVRQRVLAELGGTEGMRAAREANAGLPREPLQVMMDRCIKGDVPELDGCSLEDLECLLQVHGWIGRFQSAIPAAEEIRQRLRRKRVLAPFEALAGDFYGRERELAALRDFVGVHPPHTKIEGIRRQVRSWLGRVKRGPLVAYGIGGIGKSTLVSRFILDHAEIGGDLQIPFAYLDFDSVRLQPEHPLTLLAEMAHQLAAQYPGEGGAMSRLAAEIENEAQVSGTSQAHGSGMNARQGRLVQALSSRLAAITGADEKDGKDGDERRPPLLVILDTFEEVQYRTGGHMDKLWSLLRQLQEHWPRVRIVISGRASLTATGAPENMSVEELVIGDLDGASAAEFLQRAGVTDRRVAESVAEQVGGNPLTLKLAARVVMLEGAHDQRIRNIDTTRWLFFSADRAVVQGQLYRRILEHIHDPEVRKLAHPGLVLRRITPELIEHVLADACELPLDGRAHADRLFQELKREVALVFMETDGSLRHRPDVRRVMLGLMLREKPAEVRTIQEAAVEYYRGRETLVDRAEEIYHLLQLGVDRDLLEKRWLAGVEPYLRSAVEELANASTQTYLAAKLGIELEPSRWKQAAQEDLERHVATQERGLLEDGSPERALAVLRKHRERTPGSPLHLLEAQALAGTGRPGEAEAVIATARDAAIEAGDRNALLQCLLIGAELALLRGDVPAAEHDLERAMEIADELGDENRQTDVRMLLLRTWRTALRDGGSEELRRREGSVAGLLERMTHRELERIPEVVRDVAGLVGAGVPRVLIRALDAGGLGTLDTPQLDRVADALDRAEQSGGSGILGREIGRALGVAAAEGPRHVWSEIVHAAAGRGHLDLVVRRAARAFAADDAFRKAIAGVLRTASPPADDEPSRLA